MQESSIFLNIYIFFLENLGKELGKETGMIFLRL